MSCYLLHKMEIVVFDFAPAELVCVFVGVIVFFFYKPGSSPVIVDDGAQAGGNIKLAEILLEITYVFKFFLGVE